MIYRKIMVPVDDSKASLRALTEACGLARASDAEVLAVHVVDLAQFNWGAAEFANHEALRMAVEDAGGRVLDHASQMLAQSGVRHETKILESGGDKIADLLVDELHDAHCDLIVMGTHGFSGLMHLLMGSVAEGVLRKADVPVLLVRHQDDD
ncbi:universal stress protein [Uruburuella testudinis]|uniref:Universal stress protein n=1 Tax=Uruburuella testudinis TaxID=1282863 RepID=A0ABY4DV12_9NEIS|nr:universal stress protein [Uruburuella testudinis]UOO82303.1 universal stress protein [Uruburuella testudinis]